ncbi:hypothetical protein ACTWPB_14420 [Nocardia sp. IBHARD005]|uniref:hypothetical protein n=1 Tax=Nocardia sp. IBHARD005 TaxID=3457765 RepID=UPI004058DACC
MKLIGILIALVLFSVFAPASAQAADDSVRLSVRIDGRDIATATEPDPIRLDPNGSAEVEVSITNEGNEPVTVRRVDLSGQVVGLMFYSFSTSVNRTVLPKSTERLSYSLDLSGLSEQATGLISGSVTAYDADDTVLGSATTVTDVRGSLNSVYGLFGLALLILTLLAIADAALTVARHRMPPNRWQRGMRLLAPGLGIGLVLVFSLSALRLWMPSAERWAFIALLFAGVFFVLGYLTPTPTTAEEEAAELEEEEAALEELEEEESERRTAPLDVEVPGR